ncbi:MAG: polyphosphate polymerase domain-containing protein [Selenomonadaceae bacterium]|nr:polyphosphate polymerase domain-containing protein [Selenomonadaceae bacterium]
MYRVEDKYVLPMTDFWLLRNRIETILSPDSNSNEAGYKISSVYFDDISDTHLRDTVDGNPIRQKYRIRIYNDSFKVIKLEVKFKQYNRVLKKAQKISAAELSKLLNGETIESPNDLDNARTLFNLAIVERGLRPKVIVTYERRAFIYPAGNVRITFDSNLRGSNQLKYFGDKNLVYDYPEGTGTVLEVKYDEFLPKFIAQSLEINSMWQTANSKYRICREIFSN